MRLDRDDQRSPDDRPFKKSAAGLEEQLHGRNNGFGGVKNLGGVRMLTVGETPYRRLRPRGGTLPTG